MSVSRDGQSGERCGARVRGAAAIFAGYVASSQLAHNTIRDTGYTGISLGWGWGNHVVGKQTFARDNHITSNHIEGVMSALNDGGCAYTLGPQPNSTLSENVCIADNAPVVGSFYHDNGSRYFTTTRNVASGSPAPCLYLQGCCNAPALDIYVSDLWCRDEGAVDNGCKTSNCLAHYPGVAADCHCDVDEATVHTLASGARPAEAQAIVNAAGALVMHVVVARDAAEVGRRSGPCRRPTDARLVSGMCVACCQLRSTLHAREVWE